MGQKHITIGLHCILEHTGFFKLHPRNKLERLGLEAERELPQKHRILGVSLISIILLYGAEYPYNHVHESESGHLIEIDDTPGKERLHRYHRTGTYEEIGALGQRIVKVVNENLSHGIK